MFSENTLYWPWATHWYHGVQNCDAARQHGAQIWTSRRILIVFWRPPVEKLWSLSFQLTFKIHSTSDAGVQVDLQTCRHGGHRRLCRFSKVMNRMPSAGNADFQNTIIYGSTRSIEALLFQWDWCPASVVTSIIDIELHVSGNQNFSFWPFNEVSRPNGISDMAAELQFFWKQTTPSK